MNRTKALFLDRDGIINEDSGYVHTPDQIVFCNGIFDLCRTAQERGYLLVVVTNQAGVAKGYFSEAVVEELHCWMDKQFAAQGVTIRKFYYCPFHSNATVEAYRKDSDCRKPRPGMLLQAAEAFAIDFSRSLMVGDKLSDRIAQKGLRSIIVKSKYTAQGEYDVERLEDVIPFLY